jgi:GntR family transcriptional regulator
VARGKIERDLTSVVGVPALLRRQGVSAGTRVLSTSLVPPVEPVAVALQLGPDDLVADIVRIRLADGRPISLERGWLPESRFPGILDRPLSGSLYELLEGEYGTVAGEAVERIEVVAATSDESGILDASVGDPLLAITRRTTDAQGLPFEYSYDLFRADRTTVTVRTPGRASTGASVRVAGRVVELRGKRGVG